MAWTAVALMVVLVVVGVASYGLSWRVHERFWTDIFDRASGPMTIRFYLQPTLALIAALKDGIRDARFGHKAFFWTARRDPAYQGGRLREGAIATSQMMLIGLAMDVIYQFKVLKQFYPAEAVVMVLLLAVIPYFVFRWVVERIARGRVAPVR